MDRAGQKALCALRVTDLPSPSTPPAPPPAERTPRSSVLGGVSSQSRRRSPPGGWERSLVPAHLEPPWTRFQHRVPTHLGPLQPGSQLPPAPTPAPSGDGRLSPGAAQPRAGEPGMHPRQRRGRGAAQRPAHLEFRLLWAPPLLDQLCPDRDWAGNSPVPRPSRAWALLDQLLTAGGIASRPPGDQSSNPSAPRGLRGGGTGGGGGAILAGTSLPILPLFASPRPGFQVLVHCSTSCTSSLWGQDPAVLTRHFRRLWVSLAPLSSAQLSYSS